MGLGHSPTIITRGLIRYFDASNQRSYPGSGSNWNDLVSTSSATLFNSPAYAANNSGLIFTAGSSQYAQFSDPGSLSNFTVSVWAKLNADPTGGGCFISSIYTSTSVNFAIGRTDPYSVLRAGFYTIASGWRVSRPGFSSDFKKWHQYTMSYDGTNIRVYIDGELYSTTAHTVTTTSDNAGIRIGRRWDAGEYISAAVPVAMVYNRVLSDTEILQNYNALKNRFVNPVSPVYSTRTSYTTKGIVIDLDAGNPASYNGSGSTWRDLSGNGYDFTIYNSPTYSSSNGGQLTFVAASSQYAELSTGIGHKPVWTCEAWASMASLSNGCLINDIYNGGPVNYALLSGLFLTNDFFAGFFDGSWRSVQNGTTPTLNRWYHIVGTYDGFTLRFYRDGILIASASYTGDPTTSNIGVRIGRVWDTQNAYLSGSIGIIRLYDRPLSNNEITANFEASRSRFGL